MSTLVLGATGNIGPHVVSSLLAAGRHVRVISRNAPAARVLLGEQVEVVEGDYRDLDLVRSAAADVASLFMLTPHSHDTTSVQLGIIRELRRTEVKIVKLSGTSSAIHPDGPHACREHWEVETILARSGQPYVVLRPNAFMQTLIHQIMLPAFEATGAIPNAIAGAGISLIDAVDVGAVAAHVLTSDAFDGETLVLTGPRSVTYLEIADQVSRLTGRDVPTLDITPADVRDQLLARGLERWEAEHFQEMYQVFRNKESEYVTDDVTRVLGRAPGTVENYLARTVQPVSERVGP